jgi:ABC-type antimicrobial peptide transport system permease subunit
VGVAEDTHRGSITDHDPTAQLYLPFGAWQVNPRAAAIIARVSGDPGTVLEPMRRAMQRVMPGLPYANVRPMLDQVGRELRPWRLGATMFGVFGAIAIVLSALGLYSVIAYSVAQRTHEMGVRVALGARGVDIRRLVLSQGLRLAAIGAALGIVAALATGRFVESLLYEVSPRDPAVLAGVVTLVLGVAVAACLIPATRATRADPLEALRAD